MICFRRLTSALVILAMVPSAFALNLRLHASTTWAENINRASMAADRRDAAHHQAGAALSIFREWRTGFTTTGLVDAQFDHTPRFTQSDTLTLGPALQLRQKFGLGAYAPTIALTGGLRRRQARLDGDQGWTSTAELLFGKRLTPAWRVNLIGDWEQHDARSATFDTRHQRLHGVVTWDLSDRWQLAAGGGRLWGDFVASASGGVWSRAMAGEFGQAISDYYRTVAWGVTGLYGKDWISYRVSGRVGFWWLEVSPALGRNTSLPLRFESRASTNKVGIRYRQELWSLQWLHRF